MLRGFLEGLETGVATTPAKVAEYLRECRAKADALEHLIADLFAYARVEYLEQASLVRPIVFVRDVAARLLPVRWRQRVLTLMDGWPALLAATRICLQGSSTTGTTSGQPQSAARFAPQRRLARGS